MGTYVEMSLNNKILITNPRKLNDSYQKTKDDFHHYIDNVKRNNTIKNLYKKMITQLSEIFQLKSPQPAAVMAVFLILPLSRKNMTLAGYL
ncbi:hypothetical protein HN615_15260 [Candidatus Woesearchaeota archaeon]|jgi:hypothetical protein|nr:hypothetical protein [Candidatus Woesearchaeota archaeon]